MSRMPVALSDGDVQAMLDFLYLAGEVEGPEAFTEPVLRAFRALIRSDRGGVCNVFAGLDPRSDPERRTVLDFASIDCDWCVDVDLFWDDAWDEACRQFVERNEIVPPHPRFMLRPVRQSDVVTYREQRRNELWWHVARHFGDDGVILWLPAPDEGVLRRISFGSQKRGGVTERDVRILELLTPQIGQMYRRAARRRAVSEPTRNGLTPREYEVIHLVGEGKTNQEIARVLWLSPHTVRKHLENVYEKLEVTNRTAALAALFGAPERRSNGATTNGDGTH